MLDSCFSFPGLKCFAIGLPSQVSSDGQLILLTKTQVLDSFLSFPGLMYLVVGLPYQLSIVGQFN